MTTDIALRLKSVRHRIADAARRAGRSPSSVHLDAVSKTFPIEAVRVAAGEGQIDFGENKVQEGVSKMLEAGGLPLRWHLIGHLQSNKAARAVALFDRIHSVDSLKLLQRLEGAAAAEGKRLPVLLEVNVAGESSKFGLRPDGVPEVLAHAGELEYMQIVGVMTMPPLTPDAERARQYFRRLRELRDEWSARCGLPLAELSMGMSHDFEVAIEEGATWIRVGTALFGERT